MAESALEGALEELGLPDVLQLLTVGGKTGGLRLSGPWGEGWIYLDAGQVVHAETADASGEEAAYALAGLAAGRFRFDPARRTRERTISKSSTALLMEAARRSDEWKLIARKIPSTSHVPEFIVPEASGDSEAQINLNTREWQLLSKIDGRRSVREIAAASGLATFDAAKLLYGLVSTGLIRVREP